MSNGFYGSRARASEINAFRAGGSELGYGDTLLACHMAAELNRLVSKYQAQADDGREPTVRHYTEKVLPSFRQDLERARAVADEVK